MNGQTPVGEFLKGAINMMAEGNTDMITATMTLQDGSEMEFELRVISITDPGEEE